MKPVLMVEGVACKVLEMDYNQNGDVYRVKAIIDGQVTNLRETKDDSYPNRYEINKNLVYQNRYDELFEDMNKLLEEESNRMKLLALEYIREDSMREDSIGHKILLKQKFEAVEQRCVALEMALDKVVEYMHKDVLK